MNLRQPKVSVIIPTYNNAKYITNAIDSVLNQTYQNFEIIIIDDGSTDNTKEVLKKYAGRIHYFYQKNNGPASARNNGLRHAKGEYIAFLDADDTWLNDKLQLQIEALSANKKAGFVYANNYFVDVHGKEILNYIRKVALRRGSIVLDLFLDFFIITSGIMIRKSCVDTIGKFDESLIVGEDYEFFLRLANKYNAEVIEKKLWNRTVRKDSLSRIDSILDAKNDLETLSIFLNKNPEFYKKYKSVISQRMKNYYFDFGYSLLEKGENLSAFFQFFKSLQFQCSIQIIKNIMLCFIPYQFRMILKRKLCQK